MRFAKILFLAVIMGILLSCTLQTRSVFVMKDYNLKEADYEFNEFFDNVEDEYNLAKYFLTQPQIKAYMQTHPDFRRPFLMNYWKSKDPNPVTQENEFVKEIKSRIRYANSYFSHFDNGWFTDRGRIYIKYGEPFERLKDHTSGDSRYPYKNYEIWKYRMNNDMKYIFIDSGGYGNFRLIYSENDSSEVTLPEWRSYMGKGFDKSVLEY